MPSINLQLPAVHAAQKEIIRPKNAKFCVSICGTKLGKTLGFTIKMIHKAMTCKHRGRQYAWLAPYYDTSKIAMKYFERLLDSRLYDVNKADMTLTFKHNQNTIFFRGVNRDPENATEGEAFYHIVADEASKMVEQAIISARTTTTKTKGKIDIVSTPRGTGWLYEYYKRGQDPSDPLFVSYQYPTWANPHIDPEEIEIARKQLPKRIFDQYYGAEFLDSGEIFAGLENCIDGDVVIPNIEPTHSWYHDSADSSSVVVGVDWAKEHDYTVMVAIDYASEIPRVVGYQRLHYVKYTTSVAHLVAFCDKFKAVSVVYHDKTGVGNAIDEMLEHTSLPFEGVVFTNQSKNAMVSALLVRIEQAGIKIPRLQAMIDELESFEVQTTLSGAFRYSAPAGQHDDIVCALMLANSALNEYHGRNLNIRFLEELPTTKLRKPNKFDEYLLGDYDDDF
jgi:hypothetical protein